ncbi:MAG: efflux RND transporter permease subunit [Myxococcales bacterium]|nr:efflux RND transporter permease subunit [Myxococcales bacterium]MBL0193102.1 efflux RND transporter permease subunit [Myxococcales bacterium]
MTKIALKNPYLVVVGCLVLMVLGYVSSTRIPVDLLPTFKTPAVQVLTLYPGMPAPVVGADITSRLERWTGQSNGIARQESRSLTGVSVVRDYFREDIDPNTAMSQVSSLAASDVYYLPPGTAAPMVMPFDPTAPLPLALLSVSSSTKTEKELYDIAYFQLRNLLQGIQGVVAPAVYGGKLRRIYAYLDPDKLAARGLAPMDVQIALRAQNTFVPTGNVKIGDLDYQLESNAIPETVAELNAFPIKIGKDGAPMLVGDVGSVEDAAQIQSNIVRIDGKRQVYIPIYRQPGANTVSVVGAVKDALATLKATLGEGIDLRVVVDQSVFVKKAIAGLATEGAIGALLAGIMVYVFLGNARASAVTFLAIPLSITAAIVGLGLTRQSINAMTLGGLALAVGRLVDDAIVVLENTMRHIQAGVPPREAAARGAAEVRAPVLVATICTCIVFLPVAFLKGMGSFLFVPLALAVTYAMTASYVVAMTVVPTYSARFLARPHKGREADEHGGPLYRRVASSYRRALERAFRAKWLVALVAVASLGAAVLFARGLGQELFPRADAGHITIFARAPSGTRVEKTEAYMAQVESVIRDTIPRNDLAMVITNIGVLFDWPAAYTPNAGPGDAFMEIELTEGHSRSAEQYARTLRAAFRQRVPEIEVAFDTGGLVTAALNGGEPSPIHIQIQGAKDKDGLALAREIQRRVAPVPGAVDVRVQQTDDYPMVRVDVDRVEAAKLGLTVDDVVKNVSAAVVSSVGFEPSFWLDPKNGNHYYLGVQYREGVVDDFERLGDLTITPRKGGPPVSLRTIAKLSRRGSIAEERHVDIKKVFDVFANVDRRDVGSVTTDVERAIAGVKLPAGVNVKVSGEVAEMRSTFKQLAGGIGLAVLLIYLVLVAQFRSFLDPLSILLAVPLGGVGAMGLLWATRTTLNVQSLVGLLFMVGIAVSNSVLLVEFAARLREQGRSPADAAAESAAVRLRPILMTSLAAVLGLVPMAIGFGHGGEANVPLARAVVGGLTASTLLTLFVVPVADAWLHRNDVLKAPDLEGPNVEAIP